MKYLRLFILFMLPIFLLSGCGETKLNYSIIERDSKNIGGDLTFEYDSISHNAYFGEKGESVEYYQIDIAQGFLEPGNRVGIKLYAPVGVKEFDSGRATLGDEKFEGGEFYQSVNGVKTGEAIFYPLVSEKNRNIELKITWQDGTEEQIYHIIIKENVLFEDET